MSLNPDILSLNVQCLNSQTIDCLEVDINSYNNLKFLCLTETHARISSIYCTIIRNFSLASFYCRNYYEKGGVAIYAKSDLTVNKIDLDKFCIDKHIEICGISWKNNYKTTIILTCYRSPSGDLNIFFNVIYDVLDMLFRPNVSIILNGDFNLDSSPCSRSFTDFIKLCNVLSSFNLHPLVRWPTRVTSCTSTIIDHIFTNITDHNLVCVQDNDISDHRTVLFEFNSYTVRDSQLSYFSRTYNDNAVLNFYSAIEKEDWSDLYRLNDIDEAYDYFHKIFLYYFNIHFPLRKRYKNNNNNKAWVNDEVKVSSRNLKDLHMIKKMYPEVLPIYLNAKKVHAVLVENTKKQYYQNKIINSDNPSKVAWRVISELSGKIKNLNNIALNYNGELCEDPEELSFLFSEYFITAPLKIVNNIPSNSASVNDLSNHKNSIFLEPFAEDELHNLLKSKLKNKPSAGPDEIPSFIIKKVIHVIIQPLTYLVNLSFTSGIFPSNLKMGKVVPVYKKHDPQKVENYRPITVPPGFSKIFEYAFLYRLMNFLDKNNILSNNQHGFRSNKSTQTAMYDFYEKVIEYIEAGECPVGIFCDLSRAFDCVDHDKLLGKLYACGIRGVALDWISSFLRNRKQYVAVTHSFDGNVGSANSEYKVINMGVPQGSVLGPILFSVYTNELDTLTNDAHLIMYADDQSLIISDKHDALVENKCNNSLMNLYNWYCFYKQHLNAEKTTFMRFHNRQKICTDLNIKINDTSLSNSKNVKFLGLTLDECLNWKGHCEQLISKLNSISYLMRSLKPVLLKDQLLNLYHAQVGSRLRYGISFWGNSTLSSDVFIVQKRILRIIAGISKTCSCREVFRSYKVLTLTSILIYDLCVFVFINKAKFIINSNFHVKNTRRNDKFHIPHYKYNISINAPYCLGLKLFNHLPDDIKQAINTNSFKFKLRTYLLDKCFYTLNEFFCILIVMPHCDDSYTCICCLKENKCIIIIIIVPHATTTVAIVVE